MAERLPDRAPGLDGFRPALFLARQPFLAWTATAGCIATWFWFLTLLMNRGRPITLNGVVILVVLGPVMGYGLAVLTALPLFLVLRAFRAKVVWAAAAGEDVLTTRTANHFLGDEGRGGTLHVTTRALVFVPNRFNVQLTVSRVAWADVRGAAWYRIVTPRGVLSQLLVVRTASGEERYVVQHPEQL